MQFGTAVATAGEAYGQVIAQCGWIKGRDFDRLIAAHAIVTNLVLVTYNINNLCNINGLQVENWIMEH